MSLAPGVRLGAYEIVSLLGVGGMGEVYRAHDSRLHRDVALKVLRDDVASDLKLRARLDREARSIAQLSHPHICTLHDVGEADGSAFLVFELLEGETLASRLIRGPLPIADALTIASQIADAASAAHRKGIIHRDLKPGNIMLGRGGAKLLDFGLAKDMLPLVGGASTTTEAAPLTGQGLIVGTLHYMAPEQLEGRPADVRSDIWALGAVLYEMVTGERAFGGDTPASVVGAILKDEVPALSTRQPLAPGALNHLVQGCLAKMPEDRWQSMVDVKRQLEWIRASHIDGPFESVPRVQASVAKRRWWPMGLAAVPLLMFAALLPDWWAHRSELAPVLTQLSVLSPPETRFSGPPASVVSPQIALAPDGRQIAFVAESPRGRSSLWVRGLSAAQAQLLRGTENAMYPFWSPDGRSLGFFAQGKLKTIGLDGEPPRTLSDASLDSRGGTWGPDGTILFAPEANGPLAKISAAGGAVTPVTQLDPARRESSHRFPSFLPDGRHFLYTTRSPQQDDWGISIGSLDSPIGQPLIPRSEWGGQFAPPGHILFLRAGTLMAQAFDARRLTLGGEPTAILSDVGATTTGYAAFSASGTGSLIHASHIGAPGRLRWYDRSGNAGAWVTEPGEYLDFELSPDERTVAISRVSDPGLTAADLWLIDLERQLPTRFTVDRENEASVLWSPDGRDVVFRSNRQGFTQLYRKRSSGIDTERPILNAGNNVITSDWSRDGSLIVFTATTSTGFEIWVWRTNTDEKPRLAVRTPVNAMHGHLSPDGKWIAYASDESGELQVYVQPFPPTGDKRQMSPDGGSEPRWRRDGQELFYLATGGTLMQVAIPGRDAFKASVPHPLFGVRVPFMGNPYHTNYAVSADGQRFLVNTMTSDASLPIDIVLNWTGLLKK